MQQGNDRMSTSSDESAPGVPKLPEKATPAPILRPTVPGNHAPTPAAVRSDDQTTAKSPQPAVAPSTNKSTTPVDRSLSSARTRARAEVTPQPVVGTNPTREKTEKKRPELICSIPLNVIKPTGTAKPVGKTSRRPAEAAKPAEKIAEKIPDGLIKTKRPVANITPGTSDNQKTVSEQILHKLAKTKARPEGKPRTSPDELNTKKATSQKTPESTKQDRKDTGDSDEVLITHDDRDQTRSEATQSGTKGKHSTEPKPVASNTGKITQTPPMRSTAAQPPLPPPVTKPPTPITPPTSPLQKTALHRRPQSMIPPLPPTSEVPKTPLKTAAAIPRMTNRETAVISNKVADATSLRKKLSQELADLARAKHSPKRHKSKSHTGTPSHSDEDRGDLRGKIDALHRHRKSKTLEEPKRSVKVVCEIRSKPYDASSRQYGHNDHKGSSAKSGRERSGLTDDDRRPLWENTAGYENRDSAGPHRRSRPRSRYPSNRSNKSSGSDSDERHHRSKRRKESDRTKRRCRQESPIRTRRGGEGGTSRKQRLMEIREKIAIVATQEVTQYEHDKFKDMTHEILPVRSLEENVSHVNQYRRWINDDPPRATKIADKMLGWVLHFEASKEDPQFTIHLDSSSVEVAWWWRHFCVEIGILKEDDQVFRDLVCSAPTRKTM